MYFNFLLISMVATLHLQAYGRENILERSGKPVYIARRRVSEAEPAVLQRLSTLCPDEICGILSGDGISSLLALQPECSQQDIADNIIDASRHFDSATQATMIRIAIEFRKLEKNTPQDHSTRPPTRLNSVYCQKIPRNPELYGLVQAQDPGNDPRLFFDPSLNATVVKGSQANTFPLVHDRGQLNKSSTKRAEVLHPSTSDPDSFPIRNFFEQQEPLNNCVGVVTVKYAGSPVAIPSGAVIVTYGSRPSTTVVPSSTQTAVPDLPAGADFGRCSIPEIEFGAGYDNRRETSFRPTDRSSYNHESAQDISIISRFMCDTLENSCGANQLAKDLCAEASRVSLIAPDRTGAQADEFNLQFGIVTNFASVQVLDDQGRVVGSLITTELPASSSQTISSSAEPSATSTTGGGNNGGGDNNGLGNFGNCATPQIDFGPGFAGGPQTRFRAAFGQTTSTNINVIADELCGNIAGSCGGDATAIATCSRAQAAAARAENGTGAAADAFNAVFGIDTDFVRIPAVDSQGRALTKGAATPSPINNGGRVPQTTPNSPTGNGSTTPSLSILIIPPPPTSTVVNLQRFSGALGGVPAPAVTPVGNNQFQVVGNAIMNSQTEAIQRSCNVQQNTCSNSANAANNPAGFTVTLCGEQERQCLSQAR